MAYRITLAQTTFWEISGPGTRDRVHFEHKREARYRRSSIDAFDICSDHIVLADHLSALQDVYVVSVAPDPESLLAHMTADIAAAVGPWRPALRYFIRPWERSWRFTREAPLSVLRQGNGMIFSGPNQLAARIVTHLRDAGVESHVIDRVREIFPVRALVAGSSFVVAQDFRIERL